MRLNSPIFLTAAAAIIWGATAPIMKLTLVEIPPFSLAFIRMTLASVIMIFFVYKSLQINKVDRIHFFWAALTGVTLNLSFFFFGLKLTQAINASFLVASVPIFTILAAHFYLREKITFRLSAGAAVAFAGVAVIIGKPQFANGSAQTLGNILLLFAAISWVSHEIIAKKLLKIYKPSVVAFYTMAIGAATLLPLSLFELFTNPAWIQGVSIKGMLGLLYGIFFASLIAYWAWQKGLSKLEAGKASFFFYLNPVSGVILSMLLLGEKVSPALLFGGAAIAAGVFLAESHRRSHPLHR